MGAAARQRVIDRFTWPAVVSRCLGQYQTLGCRAGESSAVEASHGAGHDGTPHRDVRVPARPGGVSDYTRHVAEALATMGTTFTSGVHRRMQAAEHRAFAFIAEAGRFSPLGFRRLLAALDWCLVGPRRLLVQWVPHGFGYRR